MNKSRPVIVIEDDQALLDRVFKKLKYPKQILYFSYQGGRTIDSIRNEALP